MEQLQTTALDSEETTAIGEGVNKELCHTYVQLYLNHIPMHVRLPPLG